MRFPPAVRPRLPGSLPGLDLVVFCDLFMDWPWLPGSRAPTDVDDRGLFGFVVVFFFFAGEPSNSANRLRAPDVAVGTLCLPALAPAAIDRICVDLFIALP